MISYGRQSINEQDIEAVNQVLNSDFLTQGDMVTTFESALCSMTTADHCSVTNSATSALHLACMALDVSTGSLVWTSPISFVASSNCALYCGATVDFVDIDYHTHNISIEALRIKLDALDKAGRKLPDVLIVVHMAGLSCDMKAISELSIQYGFRIIEDASHGIGASYQGKPVGACEYSDLCIFSFHPVKIITTGEGGAVLTNRKDLDEKIKRLRSHGVSRDPDLLSCTDPWYYEQFELGFNYRLTDIQSALGVSQLTRLNEFIEKRRKIARQYFEMLPHEHFELPNVGGSELSSWHLYIIKLKCADNREASRRSIFSGMREKGVGVNVHYIPIYKQPYYQRLGFSSQYCEVAERYYQGCLTLPLHPSMTDQQFEYVVDSLRELVK